MSDTFEGANATNAEAKAVLTSDPFYYEADGEGDQIYLESVLPQAYDKNLEPFNTKGLRPKEYPEQNEYGMHPVMNNPMQYTYNNTNFYFQPENKM